jgi:hypothetical protein
MSALERQFVQPNRADAFLFFFFDPWDQSGVEMLLRMHQLPWVKGLVLTFSHRSGTVFGPLVLTCSHSAGTVFEPMVLLWVEGLVLGSRV